MTARLTWIPRTLLIPLVSLGLMNMALAADDARNPNIDVESVAAELANLPPAARARALANPAVLSGMLAERAVQQQIASLAESRGLAEEPVTAAKIEMMRRETLAKALINRERNRFPAPDFEEFARDSYRANPDRHLVPAQARVYSIFVRPERVAERPEARARAQEALAALDAGETFKTVAQQYSDARTAKVGGDLGYLTREALLPEVGKVVFEQLGAGEHSRVIETVNGFQIIKLGEMKPEYTRPFSEVKRDLIQELKDKYYKEKLGEFIEENTERPAFTLEPATIEAIEAKLQALTAGGE